MKSVASIVPTGVVEPCVVCVCDTGFGCVLAGNGDGSSVFDCSWSAYMGRSVIAGASCTGSEAGGGACAGEAGAGGVPVGLGGTVTSITGLCEVSGCIA